MMITAAQLSTFTMTAAGPFIEYNMTRGGEGVNGVVALVNRETGHGILWPKDEPRPRGYVSPAEGFTSIINRETGHGMKWPKDEPWSEGYVHVEEGFVSLVNRETGHTMSWPKDEPQPEGYESRTALARKDPELRRSRGTQERCEANGHIYRSFTTALRDLPPQLYGSHQAPRLQAKRDGQVELEGIVFRILRKDDDATAEAA